MPLSAVAARKLQQKQAQEESERDQALLRASLPQKTRSPTSSPPPSTTPAVLSPAQPLPQSVTRKSKRRKISPEVSKKPSKPPSKGAPTPPPPRAFSPSQPIHSDDEDNIDEASKQYIERFEESDLKDAEIEPHSHIFKAQPNSNAFKLTRNEISNVFDALHSPPPANEDNILLILPPDETISFLGTCYFTLLFGSASLMGVPLRPSTSRLYSHPIFAPKSSPIPVLTTKSFDSSSRGNNKTLDLLPSRIRDHCTLTSTIVLFQPIPTGIESLSTISPAFQGLFGEPWLEGVQSWGVNGLYPLTDVVPRGCNRFVLPHDWQEALDIALQSTLKNPGESTVLDASPFVALVHGAKNSGKSTFAKLLSNRLVTRYRRVAFLECDIGQSEFTPGGMVALTVLSCPVFGPPYSHPTQPYRAHFIGSTTPRSTPSHYLAAISDLIDTYKLTIQYSSSEELEDSDDGRIAEYVPLVVNTHGWVKGMGADLLVRIGELCDATHAFTLQHPQFETHSSFTNGALQESLTVVPNAKQFLISAIPQPNGGGARYTAADMRGLSLMGYFHHVPPTASSLSPTWSTSYSLCSTPPYETDTSSAPLRQIIIVAPGGEDVVSSEIERAICPALVGLVRFSDDYSLEHEEEGLYVQARSAPDPKQSECIGLGFIRAAFRRHTPEGKDALVLHLLTPISPALLAQTHAIVKGEMDLPVWGMLDYSEDAPPVGGDEDGGLCGVDWDKVPYLQWSGKDTAGSKIAGSAKRRVRRNVMRRGQM